MRTNKNMSSRTNTEILVFLTLAAVYVLCLSFGLWKLNWLRRISPIWSYSRIFYIILLITVIFRCLYFLGLILGDFLSNYSFMFTCIPESLFLICYILLHYLLIGVYSMSHGDPFTETKKLRSWHCGVCVTWTFLQIALVIGNVMSVVPSNAILYEIGLMNILFALLGISTLIKFNTKFSGHPIFEEWKPKLRRIVWVFIVWTVSRLMIGLLQVSTDLFEIDIVFEMAEFQDYPLSSVTMVLVKLFLGEVICIIIVLDSEFIKIFELRYDFDPLLTAESPSIEHFVIKKEIPSKLGKLLVVEDQEDRKMYREISLPRISRYIEEKTQSDFLEYQEISHNVLVPIHSFTVDFPKISLLTQYYEAGSLFDMLHVNNAFFSFVERLVIAKRLASCIAKLHQRGKVHGHITSHNIFIHGHYRVAISDFGFMPVRKYAGVLMNYSSKSPWSSPQVLLQPQSVPLTVTEFDDAYSLGIVIYELVTNEIPFKGINLKKIVEKVGREGFTLRIPDNIPSEIAWIIYSTWGRDHESRISALTIKEKLGQIIKRE